MAFSPADVAQIIQIVRSQVLTVPGTMPAKNLSNGVQGSGQIVLASALDAAVANNGPKITSGGISSGPPAAPNDGDIWIALAAGSAGENWTFRYNAESSSPYKWEFIGGPPLVSNTLTANRGGGSVWTDISILTMPRAGDYIFRASTWAPLPTGTTQELGIGQNSTTSVISVYTVTNNLSTTATLNYGTSFVDVRLNGLNAADVMYLNLWANSAASTVVPASVSYSATPVRIS